MSARPTMVPRVLDRVVLRRLRSSDLADFQAYRHDPGLGLYQGWEPMSDGQALAFLRDVQSSSLLRPGHWSQIAIADPRSLRLLGDIGLFVDDAQRHAEIGFTLARAHQGRGLATEAVRGAIDLVFEHTGVGRVQAVTDTRNTASIRLLERVGLSLASTSEAIFRGEPCTEHTFVMDRPTGA